MENTIYIYKNKKQKEINKNNFTSREDNPIINKKRNCTNCLIIVSLIILCITGIVIFVLFKIKNNGDGDSNKQVSDERIDSDKQIDSNGQIDSDKQIDSNDFDNIDKDNQDIEEIDSKSKKLETEFKLNTKINDLKRFNVHHKYYEDIMIDNNINRIFLDTQTIYDIFIISEEDSKDEEKDYYNKIYTGAISIVSECFSRENETCVPQKLVDLINSNINNNSNVEEINDLKDIPLPLCLFKITDNNIITSITCHKSLEEHKKRMIVLDLYFFRPPSIKRLDKKELNITITHINLDKKKKLIREKHGGICDIENPYSSFCTKDINITIDSNSNLLEYDEISYIMVKTDENNSYEKNQIIKLIDETYKISSFTSENYQQILNKLLSKLEPYFQIDELFSKENFEEIYIASKQGIDKLREKLKYRRLNTEKKAVVMNNNVLNFNSINGIGINLDFIINSGLNSTYYELYSKLKTENNQKFITTSKKSSLNFNKLINQLTTLYEAGINLITKLFQKTNNSLDIITQEINETMTNLNSLVKYKDFSEIFNSTLSSKNLHVLPISIIEEITNLKNKLSQLLNEIENGEIRNNINLLYNNINEYTRNSHNLIYELFDNLKYLSESLNLKKSKLTEISTYYLNHTSYSFIGIIQESEKILNNYYKLEYNSIKSKVNLLLKNFEDNLIESLQKESEIINYLYKNLENKDFTIQNTTDEDYQRTLNNLYYIKNAISEIVNSINDKILKEIDIKDSGYFISNDDIDINNNSFSDIIDKLLKIINLLDNNEYIDKTFDHVMIKFRENCSNIIKDMDKKKEELIPLNEDVLNESLFTESEKNYIQQNISQFGINILNKIINENNYYLNQRKEIIEKFLIENKQYLYNLTSDLIILFSEESLKELANLYEKAFDSCLNKINNELNQNELLSKEYFNNLEAISNNKTKIKELLQNYLINDVHLIKEYLPFYQFEDSIISSSITEAYITKYEIFKTYFVKSKQYINNQLFKELLLEYKKTMNKIREVLQNFKNNKLSDKYLNLDELFFVDDHIRSIDNLYNRLNNYISNNIYNSQYLRKIQEYKNNKTLEITKLNENIENQNQKIYKNNIVNDHINDFCVTFLRKKNYINGLWAVNINSDYYCFPLLNSSNNYMKLIAHSIDLDDNLKIFNNKFISFYSSINEKVKSYTEKIEELKNSLTSLEQKTINQNITLNYLNEIKNEINSLLNKKYGDEIIKSSYNYYKNNIEGIMGNLLNNITIQWNEAYGFLYDELQTNLDIFKNSINEFGLIITIYKSLILQNITKIYFDSIIIHQKNEFNYTISYYYNYLLKLVKSTHQYIINKIPINNVGFNNTIEQRKKEVNDLFNSLIQDIIYSKNLTLSENRIIYVLQVPKTNFFKVNNILSDNILKTNNSLSTIISNILMIRNNKVNNEFSLTSRFYLENSINGKKVEEFYEQINNKGFVYLNLEKFKELLIEKIIFGQDEFINKLNKILYDFNLEISQEFLTLKEDFSNQLESQISNFLTKDEIEERITELYKSEVKELEITQIKEIKQNVMEILMKIKEHLSKEAERLNTTLNSYNIDYTIIQNRLNEYKKDISNKLETVIFKIIDDFHQNMIDKVYINYVEKYLNEYIKESKAFTSQCEEVKLLNSSYKIGEIIDNIIENLVNEYKIITQLKINSKYNEYHAKINNQVSLDELKILINNEITEGYNSILYPILKEKYNSNDSGNNKYDLNDEIKKDIESTINIKINIIEKIMSITKGNNHELNLNNWKILDKTSINDNILINIKNSFDKFIEAQKINEENNFNNILQDIIKSNFNNLLNNIFPSFGNSFFERIIKYNENFKISSLYNNIKFSLVETILYYVSLRNINKIQTLTKDLKIKVLSLNNLDLIVEKMNNQVINYLKTKIDEFIIDSKEYIIKQYKTMIETYSESNFNELISQKVKENMNLIQDEIEKDYTSILNKYFKEEFIISYTNIMKIKTDEMIQVIENNREILKINIEDLFTIEPDAVLNDINIKIKNTINSIEKINYHLSTFKISEELINYFENYGETKVKPSYGLIINILNNKIKNTLILNIEEKYQNYEKYFNQRDFIEQTNNIYSRFSNNYIKKMKENINDYGINDYSYNLENEIDKLNEKNRKNIKDILTDEEIKIINQEKIADKTIDDIFKNLLTFSNNTKTYINVFEEFDKFDKLITKYINKVNSAHKSSQKIIFDKNYEKNIHKTLNEKLEYITQMNLDYYKQINESYYRLKKYLIESVHDIDNGLNECANITYNTFKDKYNEILKETTSFDNEELEISEEINQDSFEIQMQNQKIIVNYKIPNLVKNARIKYDLQFENVEIKNPKIKASIINENKPKKINFDLIRIMNGCGKIVEAYEVEFNDVNNTMNIDFNIKSRNINFTTINNIESYQFSKEVYQIEEEIHSNCYFIQNIFICIHNTFCDEDDKKIISAKKYKIISQNKNVNTIIKN